MIKHFLNSQWIYGLVRYTSATLCGLALAGTLPISAARAQSVAPADDGTGTIVNQTDTNYEITGGTQAGSNLFHSFEQLGLESNEAANIISSPDVNNILGRVVGGDASFINGLLHVAGSDANLFLMNPAGVIFGPEAQVLVPGSFTATTADAIQLDDAWFNALGSNDYATMFGDPSEFAFSSSASGAVINAGSIASSGESVTLLGGVVVNTGTIETAGGTINVVAIPGENSVEITPEGSLLTLALPTDAQSVLNPSSQGLAASDLPALLSGEEIGDTLGVVVDDGVIKLIATDTTIPTDAGTAIASGTLDASNILENGVGGNIDVLGDRVGLLDANLEASGTNGGGNIRIGGDFQGAGPVANAKRTYVNATSTIAVDALERGDGGRVIVWADEAAQFLGSISARGEGESGDGGFAEVSGKQSLSFDGIVDLTSRTGNQGQLLLDPESVFIDAINSGNANLDDNVILAEDPGGFVFISTGGIRRALSNGTVTIAATDTITVNSSISDSAITFGGPSNGLTLRASTIDINASISSKGDLTLEGSDLITIDTADSGLSLNSDSGDIRLTGGDIAFAATEGSIALGAGNNNNITMIGKDITLESNNNRQISLDAPSLSVAASNNLTIEGQGKLLANRGDISLQAGNDLRLSGKGDSYDFEGRIISLQTVGDVALTGENVTIDSTEGAVFIESSKARTTLEAESVLTVIDALGEVQQTQILSGSDMRLQGNKAVNITAVNNDQSFFISDGDINLVSDGLIVGNGRFLADDDVTFTTVSGAAGSFTYSPLSSPGVISVDGDVSFEAYEGPSLKIEATGSITGGNITINGSNPNQIGSDPETFILANSSSVILRAGLAPYQLVRDRPPNLDAVQNQPNINDSETFSVSSPSDVLANITVGAINTQLGGNGTVILKAPGDISTGQINTGIFSMREDRFRVSNELSIASGGSLSITDVGSDETSYNSTSIYGNGLSINLSASESISTDAIVTRDRASFNGSATVDQTSVALSTQAGDIQVGYITTGEGGVNIESGGSFRAVDSFLDERGGNVDTISRAREFVDFLISEGYYSSESEIPRSSSGDFLISLAAARRVSILVNLQDDTSAEILVPISIQYGDADKVFNGESFQASKFIGTTIQYQILESDKEPFVIGPGYENETAFAPRDSADSLENFNPDEPFGFKSNDSMGYIFPSDEFPASASGLSAGIAVRSGANGTLYGGIQSQLLGDNVGESEVVLDPPVVDGVSRETPVDDPALVASIDDIPVQESNNLHAPPLCEGNEGDETNSPDELLAIDETILSESIELPKKEQASGPCSLEEGVE